MSDNGHKLPNRIYYEENWPAFLTRNRYEKEDKPMDTRRAKENTRKGWGCDHREHLGVGCSMLSTFFKRNAVDMGLYAFAVDSW